MKQTRTIVISERVFTAQDLIRLARIFDEQPTEKGISIKTEYWVRFQDNTKFESDTPEVFQEESLTAHGRPVAISMSYRDYERGRYISLSLSQGDSSYGNEATVSAGESEWVNANFQSLQDALNRVKPQKVWFRRHQDLLLNLIALGIGCTWFWAMDVFDWVVTKMGTNPIVYRPPEWLVQALSSMPWLGPAIFLAGWFFRWFAGIAFGAFSVRRWLLAMWPSIEFDFGLPHLQIEKIQRQRLALILTLIIVPIGRSLLYDLIKHL